MDAKQQSMKFAEYKRTLKRTWVAEKADLMSLLGNIKTKLGTYGLKDYTPPAHLSLPNLDRVWTSLMQAENRRSVQINQKIREYVAQFLMCQQEIMLKTSLESKSGSGSNSPRRRTSLPYA